ncbi:MAG: aminopeptidase P family protein [Phycisphaerales bacterium]|nr:aminopeptidase P family protein [Phycisphaerales bacterium]
MTPALAGKSKGARAGTQPFLAARADRLRSALAEQELDALLITTPNDIRYLTGFSGDDSTMLVTADRLIVLSDFRFQEELEEVKDGGLAEVYIRSGEMLDAVQTVVHDVLGDEPSLGVQAEQMTVAMRKRLGRAVGAKRLRDTVGLVGELRLIKDELEVKIIRKAISIQQDALTALRGWIKPGQTELEIAGRLELELKARGATGPAFPTIAAARANGSLPHAVPGQTKTAAGQPLLIDWGARVAGYNSDLTRTLTLGKWPKEIAKIYPVVLEAQRRAIEAIAPGVRCEDVDAVARGHIADAGYGPQFGHSLGHGIGLNVHEDPRLGKKSKHVLRPGMIVTVEPGIYLPGVGGVRIEDDVLVTENGCRVLSTIEKSMEWATLP